MRYVILHHHIFKNAGSSLDFALHKFFGSDFCEFHPQNSSDGRVTPQQLFNLLDENKNIKAVSSHHFFGRNYEHDLNKLNRDDYYFFDLVLIRHPLSRLASTYLYYKKLPIGEHPLLQASHQMCFRDFVEHVLCNHPNFVVNPQVTMFGCKHYGAPPSPANLESAERRIMEAALLGTVEKYDKSIMCGEYFLQPVFPGIDLVGPSVNTSKFNAIPDYDGTPDSLVSCLGTELYRKLKRSSDLDIELWKSASLEVDRRMEYVKNGLIQNQKNDDE